MSEKGSAEVQLEQFPNDFISYLVPRRRVAMRRKAEIPAARLFSFCRIVADRCFRRSTRRRRSKAPEQSFPGQCHCLVLAFVVAHVSAEDRLASDESRTTRPVHGKSSA